jgi:CRISPR/Cas system-associated protein endoribonuclease Cas2
MINAHLFIFFYIRILLFFDNYYLLPKNRKGFGQFFKNLISKESKLKKSKLLDFPQFCSKLKSLIHGSKHKCKIFPPNGKEDFIKNAFDSFNKKAFLAFLHGNIYTKEFMQLSINYTRNPLFTSSNIFIAQIIGSCQTS